jgi:hypothetical protein
MLQPRLEIKHRLAVTLARRVRVLSLKPEPLVVAFVRVALASVLVRLETRFAEVALGVVESLVERVGEVELGLEVGLFLGELLGET